MNDGPESILLSSTSMPPTQSTMMMSTVPRNSLIGCAICWRMFTRCTASRYSLLMFEKRVFILSSAQNAFTMRSPPSVSSTCDIVSLQSDCALIDFFLSFLPTQPMNHPKIGTKTMVKSVSCHEMKMSAPK